MQLGHAVDGEAADDSQEGHAHHGLVAFLDQRHAAAALRIAGPALLDLDQKAFVDLEDDLHDSRQHRLHHLDGPALERLG